NSSGVAQPLELCSNGRLKAAINKETGWIGKCGAEEYRKEVVKRIEDGLFACLFPSTVRVGFDLSGYLEGKAENCLSKLPEEPQVSEEIRKSYHPKVRGFALGDKLLTDQTIIDKWYAKLDLNQQKLEEKENQKRIKRRDITEDINIIANKSGYMTKETLQNDCMPHFLMIFDSHPSRGDIDMVRELRLHNIDALTIVPNSSGVAQPLELCSNGRLKAAINKETGWIGKCGAEEYRKEVVK
ncbi:MAG: hypothetical protein EZS28_043860, partial [Streblomastix strix]